MEYFNKIKDITNIKNIRTNQLEKQKQIDLELHKLNSTCPDIITEYLLFQRHFSRIQQQEMIESNMINLFSIIHKHFDENNKIYKEFDKILTYDNNLSKCENLYKLINN
jgi:hypothetical protein